MLFDNDAILRIKTIISKDNYAKEGWEIFLKEIDQVNDQYIIDALSKLAHLQERAENIGGAKVYRYGHHVMLLAKHALKLAYGYQVTKDQDKLYYAKRFITIVQDVEKWISQGTLNGWDSDLMTADIGSTIAIAYDSIKSEFSSEEKVKIEKALYEKGLMPIYKDWIDPVNRIHALDSMGHNWWSVCVGGAGIILLVIKEGVKDYQEFLDCIVEGFEEWLRYPGNVLQNKKGNLGPDGDFVEYVGYMSYAFCNFSVFEELYRKTTGDDRFFKIEILAKLPDFYISLLQILKSGVQPADFGDTTRKITSNAHFIFYLANYYSRGDLLAFFQKMYQKPTHPFDFYFYPEEPAEYNYKSLPLEAVYNHTGFAVVRSGYNEEDTFFAIKTGESWNHNHRDVGSFVLSYNGNEFIIDSGHCIYTNPVYLSYYVTPQAHNVILKDGEGQPQDATHCGTKYCGCFPVFLNTPFYKYLLADCTGPYTNIYQRFYRHILFVDKLIIFIDDLFAYSEGKFEWLLHYNGEMKHLEEKTEIKCGDDVLGIYHLFPEQKEFSIEDGFLHEIRLDFEDGTIPEASYIKIKAQSKDRRGKFINVFGFKCEENKNIDITTSGNDEIHEVIIKKEKSVERVICNIRADGRIMHQNSITCYDQLETDGFFTFILNVSTE